MSDGEVMERLWSYLRPTAKITKEMTPAHRVDTLTDFLMHYAKKSISNLGNLAVNLHVFFKYSYHHSISYYKRFVICFRKLNRYLAVFHHVSLFPKI